MEVGNDTLSVKVATRRCTIQIFLIKSQRHGGFTVQGAVIDRVA